MRPPNRHHGVSVRLVPVLVLKLTCCSYMLKIRLPETVMECAAMKALWRETVYICLILNDIYSVQKEIVS